MNVGLCILYNLKGKFLCDVTNFPQGMKFHCNFRRTGIRPAAAAVWVGWGGGGGVKRSAGCTKLVQVDATARAAAAALA